MRRPMIWTLTVIFAGAAPALAETRVSLSPDVRQDEGAFPFRSAKMEIFNGTDRIVRAVAVRARSGGPTILVPAVVPPNTSQTIGISLPAISVEQTYSVRLLSRDEISAKPIASLEVPVSWQAAMVTPDAFFDPGAYDDAFRISWPGSLRRNALLLSVLTVVLAAGCLLPRGKGRLAGCLLVAAVGVASAVMLVRSQPLIATRQSDEKITIQARRTIRWRSEAIGLAPVYLDRRQWREDDLLIHPRRGLAATIRPSDVRVFRALKD